MNLAAVGAFVLLLGAALIAAVLWLASGGASRTPQDLYLAVMTESVAGLSLNAPVKYNGVDVGSVRAIALDPANPERVRLSLAIARGTPIRVDTVAVLRTQGLTGIGYVELAGGAPDAAPLLPAGPGLLPQLRTRPSLGAKLETLLTRALTQLDSSSTKLDALLSPQNRDAFGSALADIATLARTLAARQATIDRGLTDAGRTLAGSADAAAQLGPLIDRAGRAADALARLGDAGTLASQDAGAAVGAAGQSVGAAGRQLQRLGADTLPELQALLGELGRLSVALRQLAEQTGRNPAGLLLGQPRPDGPGETASGDPGR